VKDEVVRETAIVHLAKPLNEREEMIVLREMLQAQKDQIIDLELRVPSKKEVRCAQECSTKNNTKHLVELEGVLASKNPEMDLVNQVLLPEIQRAEESKISLAKSSVHTELFLEKYLFQLLRG